MRGALIADLFLGFATVLFQDRKDKKVIAYINKVVALKAAGGNVDVHMQAVADYLQGGKPLDFKELTKRVNSEVDELLGRGQGEQEAPPDDASDDLKTDPAE